MGGDWWVGLQLQVVVGGVGRGEFFSCDNNHVTLCGLEQNPVLLLQQFENSSADVQTPDIMSEIMGRWSLKVSYSSITLGILCVV